MGSGASSRGGAHLSAGRHFLAGHHHHRSRQHRHMQHRHLHRKAGDGDTIRRMLANLPAKRSTRRIIQFDDTRTRTRTSILMQSHLNRYKHLNRRISGGQSPRHGQPPPPQPNASREDRRRVAGATPSTPRAAASWEALPPGSPLVRSTTPAGRRSRSLLVPDADVYYSRQRRSSLPPPERPETPSRHTRQSLQKASSEKGPLPLLDPNRQRPSTRNRAVVGFPLLPPPEPPNSSRPQTPRPKTPVTAAQPVSESPARPRLRTPQGQFAPNVPLPKAQVSRTQSPSPRRSAKTDAPAVQRPHSLSPQKASSDLPQVPLLRSRSSRFSLDMTLQDNSALPPPATPPPSPAKLKKSPVLKSKVTVSLEKMETEEDIEAKLHQTRSKGKLQELSSPSTDSPPKDSLISDAVDQSSCTNKNKAVVSELGGKPDTRQTPKQKLQKGKTNKVSSEVSDISSVTTVEAYKVELKEEAKVSKIQKNRGRSRLSDSTSELAQAVGKEIKDGNHQESPSSKLSPSPSRRKSQSCKGKMQTDGQLSSAVSPDRKGNCSKSTGHTAKSPQKLKPEDAEEERKELENGASASKVDEPSIKLKLSAVLKSGAKASKSKKSLAVSKLTDDPCNLATNSKEAMCESVSVVIPQLSMQNKTPQKKENLIFSPAEDGADAATELSVPTVVKSSKQNAKTKKAQAPEKVEDRNAGGSIETAALENAIISQDGNVVEGGGGGADEDDEDDEDSESDSVDDANYTDDMSEDDTDKLKFERHPDGSRTFATTHRLRAMPIIRFKPKAAKKVPKKAAAEGNVSQKGVTPVVKTQEESEPAKFDSGKKAKGKVKSSASVIAAGDVVGESDLPKEEAALKMVPPDVSEDQTIAPPASDVMSPGKNRTVTETALDETTSPHAITAETPTKRRKSGAKSKQVQGDQEKGSGSVLHDVKSDQQPTEYFATELSSKTDAKEVPENSGNKDAQSPVSKGNAEEKRSKISDRTRQKMGRLSKGDDLTRLDSYTDEAMLPVPCGESDNTEEGGSIQEQGVRVPSQESFGLVEETGLSPRSKSSKAQKKNTQQLRKSLTADSEIEITKLDTSLPSITSIAVSVAEEETPTEDADIVKKSSVRKSKSSKRKRASSVTDSTTKAEPVLPSVDGDKVDEITNVDTSANEKSPPNTSKNSKPKKTGPTPKITLKISKHNAIVESSLITAVVESVENLVTKTEEITAQRKSRSPKQKKSVDEMESAKKSDQIAPVTVSVTECDVVENVISSDNNVAESGFLNTSESRDEKITAASETTSPPEKEVAYLINSQEGNVQQKVGTGRRRGRPPKKSKIAQQKKIDAHATDSPKLDLTVTDTSNMVKDKDRSIVDDTDNTSSTPFKASSVPNLVAVIAVDDLVGHLAKENTGGGAPTSGEVTLPVAKKTPPKRRAASAGRKSRKSSTVEIILKRASDLAIVGSGKSSDETLKVSHVEVPEKPLSPNKREPEVRLTGLVSPRKEMKSENATAQDELQSEKGIILAAMKAAMMGAVVNPTVSLAEESDPLANLGALVRSVSSRVENEGIPAVKESGKGSGHPSKMSKQKAKSVPNLVSISAADDLMGDCVKESAADGGSSADKRNVTVTKKTSPKRRATSAGRKSKKNIVPEVNVIEKSDVDTFVSGKTTVEALNLLHAKVEEREVSKNKCETKTDLTNQKSVRSEAGGENVVPQNDLQSEKDEILAGIKAALEAEAKPTVPAAGKSEVKRSESVGRRKSCGISPQIQQPIEGDRRDQRVSRKKICRECGRDFSSNSSFWKHIQRHRQHPYDTFLETVPRSARIASRLLEAEGGDTLDYSYSGETSKPSTSGKSQSKWEEPTGGCPAATTSCPEESEQSVSKVEESKETVAENKSIITDTCELEHQNSLQDSSVPAEDEVGHAGDTDRSEGSENRSSVADFSAERRISEESDEMPLSRLKLTGEQTNAEVETPETDGEEFQFHKATEPLELDTEDDAFQADFQSGGGNDSAAAGSSDVTECVATDILNLQIPDNDSGGCEQTLNNEGVSKSQESPHLTAPEVDSDLCTENDQSLVGESDEKLVAQDTNIVGCEKDTTESLTAVTNENAAEPTADFAAAAIEFLPTMKNEAEKSSAGGDEDIKFSPFAESEEMYLAAPKPSGRKKRRRKSDRQYLPAAVAISYPCCDAADATVSLQPEEIPRITVTEVKDEEMLISQIPQSSEGGAVGGSEGEEDVPLSSLLKNVKLLSKDTNEDLLPSTDMEALDVDRVRVEPDPSELQNCQNLDFFNAGRSSDLPQPQLRQASRDDAIEPQECDVKTHEIISIISHPEMQPTPQDTVLDLEGTAVAVKSELADFGSSSEEVVHNSAQITGSADPNDTISRTTKNLNVKIHLQQSGRRSTSKRKRESEVSSASEEHLASSSGRVCSEESQVLPIHTQKAPKIDTSETDVCSDPSVDAVPLPISEENNAESLMSVSADALPESGTGEENALTEISDDKMPLRETPLRPMDGNVSQSNHESPHTAEEITDILKESVECELNTDAETTSKVSSCNEPALLDECTEHSAVSVGVDNTTVSRLVDWASEENQNVLSQLECSSELQPVKLVGSTEYENEVSKLPIPDFTSEDFDTCLSAPLNSLSETGFLFSPVPLSVHSDSSTRGPEKVEDSEELHQPGATIDATDELQNHPSAELQTNVNMQLRSPSETQNTEYASSDIAEKSLNKHLILPDVEHIATEVTASQLKNTEQELFGAQAEVEIFELSSQLEQPNNKKKKKNKHKKISQKRANKCEVSTSGILSDKCEIPAHTVEEEEKRNDGVAPVNMKQEPEAVKQEFSESYLNKTTDDLKLIFQETVRQGDSELSQNHSVTGAEEQLSEASDPAEIDFVTSSQENLKSKSGITQLLRKHRKVRSSVKEKPENAHLPSLFIQKTCTVSDKITEDPIQHSVQQIIGETGDGIKMDFELRQLSDLANNHNMATRTESLSATVGDNSAVASELTSVKASSQTSEGDELMDQNTQQSLSDSGSFKQDDIDNVSAPTEIEALGPVPVVFPIDQYSGVKDESSVAENTPEYVEVPCTSQIGGENQDTVSELDGNDHKIGHSSYEVLKSDVVSGINELVVHSDYETVKSEEPSTDPLAIDSNYTVKLEELHLGDQLLVDSSNRKVKLDEELSGDPLAVNSSLDALEPAVGGEVKCSNMQQADQHGDMSAKEWLAENVIPDFDTHLHDICTSDVLSIEVKEEKGSTLPSSSARLEEATQFQAGVGTECRENPVAHVVKLEDFLVEDEVNLEVRDPLEVGESCKNETVQEIKIDNVSEEAVSNPAESVELLGGEGIHLEELIKHNETHTDVLFAPFESDRVLTGDKQVPHLIKESGNGDMSDENPTVKEEFLLCTASSVLGSESQPPVFAGDTYITSAVVANVPEQESSFPSAAHLENKVKIEETLAPQMTASHSEGVPTEEFLKKDTEQKSTEERHRRRHKKKSKEKAGSVPSTQKGDERPNTKVTINLVNSHNWTEPSSGDLVPTIPTQLETSAVTDDQPHCDQDMQSTFPQISEIIKKENLPLSLLAENEFEPILSKEVPNLSTCGESEPSQDFGALNNDLPLLLQAIDAKKSKGKKAHRNARSKRDSELVPDNSPEGAQKSFQVALEGTSDFGKINEDMESVGESSPVCSEVATSLLQTPQKSAEALLCRRNKKEHKRSHKKERHLAKNDWENGIHTLPAESTHSGLSHIKDAVNEMQVTEVKISPADSRNDIASVDLTRSPLPLGKDALYACSQASGNQINLASRADVTEPSNDPTVELSKLDEMLNRIALPEVVHEVPALGHSLTSQTYPAGDDKISLSSSENTQREEVLSPAPVTIDMEVDDYEVPTDVNMEEINSANLLHNVGGYGGQVVVTDLKMQSTASEEAGEKHIPLADIYTEDEKKIALSGILLSLALPSLSGEKFKVVQSDVNEKKHHHRHHRDRKSVKQLDTEMDKSDVTFKKPEIGQSEHTSYGISSDSHHTVKLGRKEKRHSKKEKNSEADNSNHFKGEMKERSGREKSHHKSSRKNHHKEDKLMLTEENHKLTGSSEEDFSRKHRINVILDKVNEFNGPKHKTYKINQGPSTPPGEPFCEVFSPLPTGVIETEMSDAGKAISTKNTSESFTHQTKSHSSRSDRKIIPIPRQKGNKKRHSKLPGEDTKFDPPNKHELNKVKDHKSDSNDTFLEDYVYKSSTRMHSLSAFGRTELYNQVRKGHGRDDISGVADNTKSVPSSVCGNEMEIPKECPKSPPQKYIHQAVHPLQLLLDAARADENGFLSTCDRNSNMDSTTTNYSDPTEEDDKLTKNNFVSFGSEQVSQSKDVSRSRKSDRSEHGNERSRQQQKKSSYDDSEFPSSLNGRRDVHRQSKKTHRRSKGKDRVARTTGYDPLNKVEAEEGHHRENSDIVSSKYNLSTEAPNTISKPIFNHFTDQMSHDNKSHTDKLSVKHNSHEIPVCMPSKMELESIILDNKSPGLPSKIEEEHQIGGILPVPSACLDTTIKSHTDKYSAQHHRKQVDLECTSEETPSAVKKPLRLEKSPKDHHKHHSEHSAKQKICWMEVEHGMSDQRFPSEKVHRKDHRKHHRHHHHRHRHHHRKEEDTKDLEHVLGDECSSSNLLLREPRKDEEMEVVEVADEPQIPKNEEEAHPLDENICTRQAAVDTILSDEGMVPIPVEILVTAGDADSNLRRHEEKRVREELEDMLQVLEGNRRSCARTEISGAVTTEQVSGFGGEFGIFPLSDAAEGQQNQSNNAVDIDSSLTLAASPPPLLQHQLPQVPSASELTEDEIIEILSEVEGKGAIRDPSPLVTPKKDFQQNDLKEERPYLKEGRRRLQEERMHMAEETPRLQEVGRKLKQEGPLLQEEELKLQEETPDLQEERSHFQEEQPHLQEEHLHLQEEGPDLHEERPHLQEEKLNMQDERPQLLEEGPHFQLQGETLHLQEERHLRFQEERPQLEEEVCLQEKRQEALPRMSAELLSDAEDDLPLSLSACLSGLPLATSSEVEKDVTATSFGPSTPSEPPVLQPCDIDEASEGCEPPLLPSAVVSSVASEKDESVLDEKLGPPTLDLIAESSEIEVIPVKEGEIFGDIPVLSPAPVVAVKEIVDTDKKHKHRRRSRQHSGDTDELKQTLPPISIKITLPIADISEPAVTGIKVHKKKEHKKHKRKEYVKLPSPERDLVINDHNVVESVDSFGSSPTLDVPSETTEEIHEVDLAEKKEERVPLLGREEPNECGEVLPDSTEKETVGGKEEEKEKQEAIAEEIVTVQSETKEEQDNERESLKPLKKKQTKSPPKRKKDAQLKINTEDSDAALARTISAPRPRRLAKEVALKEVRNHFLIDGQLEALIGANVEDELSLLAVDSALFGVADQPSTAAEKSKQDKAGSRKTETVSESSKEVETSSSTVLEDLAVNGHRPRGLSGASALPVPRMKRRGRSNSSKEASVTDVVTSPDTSSVPFKESGISVKKVEQLMEIKESKPSKGAAGAEETRSTPSLKRSCGSPEKSPETKRKTKKAKTKAEFSPPSKLEGPFVSKVGTLDRKDTVSESHNISYNVQSVEIENAERETCNESDEHGLQSTLEVADCKDSPPPSPLPSTPQVEDIGLLLSSGREKRSTRCNLSYEEMYTSSDVTTSETDNSQELPPEDNATRRVRGSAPAVLTFPARSGSDDSENSDDDSKQKSRTLPKKKGTAVEAGTLAAGTVKRCSSAGSSKFYCAPCEQHFTTAYNLAKHARSNRHIARASSRLPTVGVEENPDPASTRKGNSPTRLPAPLQNSGGVRVAAGVSGEGPATPQEGRAVGTPTTVGNGTSADSSLADVAEESEGEILRNQESGWERRVSIHMSLCEILRAKGEEAVKDPATPPAPAATETLTPSATRADSVASSADDLPLSTSDDTNASFKVREAEAIVSDTGSVWPSPATTIGGGEDSPAPSTPTPAAVLPMAGQPPPAVDSPVTWHAAEWQQGAAWEQGSFESSGTPPVPPQVEQWAHADSAPWASSTPPLPHPAQPEAWDGQPAVGVVWGGSNSRDAWGRPEQQSWERDSSTSLVSFVDSFSQSLQILGTRVLTDAEDGSSAASVRTPGVIVSYAPYSMADPASLKELQNAMGATDEEMAILQQLGGDGPIWGPVKSEAAVPDEEEDEADIMDLDRQRNSLEEPQKEGAGSTVAEGGEKSATGTPAARCVAPSRTDALHQQTAPQRAAPQRQSRAPRTAGSSVESLLRAYETKEMVCPSCHRFFLGVAALQQHVTVAHQGQVGPPPLKKSRTSATASSFSKRGSGGVGWQVGSGTSSGAGDASVAAATSVLGTTADAPRRLACPHCRELLAGREAFAAHIAEDHPASMTAAGSTGSSSPLACSEEAEGLKTHISTALGGLLDRALNNLLERGLSPGLNAPTLSLLQKLTARRQTPTTTTSAPRSGPVYNTELAKQVRMQLMTRPKVGLSMLRASGVAESHPYVCFYCESRFEQQGTRNRHMVRVHKDEIISSKPRYSVKQEAQQAGDDPDDPSGGEDSDHSWREPSPTSWEAEPSGGDMGGDGDFLCSDCGINFSTPQEVLAHRKAEHSRPEPPPAPSPVPVPSPAPAKGRGRGASRPPPTSPPNGETIRLQAMAALRELGAQSRKGGGRGASQAKWGMRFPLTPAEGVVKPEPGATFSLPMVRKSSGPGPRFTSLEKKRGRKSSGAAGKGEEPTAGPSPARLDVYEFADEETLSERPELQRRVPSGTVVAVPDTTTAAETGDGQEATTSKNTGNAQRGQSDGVRPAGEDADADRPGGRPQRRERRRKSCADFPSDLSDVLDESDSDDASRPAAVGRGSASSRGVRRQRRGAARRGSCAGRGRGRGRGRGGGRRPAHTALAVTGAAPPAPVAVSASSEDEDADVNARPPAKMLCRSATPDDSSQSSSDVKGGAVALGAAAARRRRRRAKSDLLISVFRAKARHVPASELAGADSSEDGGASGGTDPAV